MIVAFAVRLADRLQKILPALSVSGIEDRSYS